MTLHATAKIDLGRRKSHQLLPPVLKEDAGEGEEMEGAVEEDGVERAEVLVPDPQRSR